MIAGRHAGFQYVLSVSPQATAFAPGTIFAVPSAGAPPAARAAGFAPTASRRRLRGAIAELKRRDWQTGTFRDGPDGEPMSSRFAFVRVRAATAGSGASPPSRARSG
jgi:hypothetical protein